MLVPINNNIDIFKMRLISPFCLLWGFGHEGCVNTVASGIWIDVDSDPGGGTLGLLA